MSGRPTTVLLAAGIGKESATLRRWFTRRGWECQFAASFEGACRKLSQAEFDLVLCQYDLPDRTAFPLLDWLLGTRSTLVFSTDCGGDSRWLPVIERGKRCLDRSLLRMPDLPNALASILNGHGMRSSRRAGQHVREGVGTGSGNREGESCMTEAKRKPSGVGIRTGSPLWHNARG